MIITKTPLRLSIGGGGTDLPFFYPIHGGELITAAINKYVYVTVAERKFHNNFRVSYSKTEETENKDKIENTRVREALKFLDINDPLEISTISEVPGSSGLGSSSAFLVGLLNALHLYKREHVSSKVLAEEAAEIEINLLKEPIGKQDQYASALGGINNLKINKKGLVTSEPINVSLNVLRDLERNLHIFFTGITRNSTEILKDQAKKATEEDRIKYMLQIKEIGADIKRALERGDLKKFGRLLDLHWEIKKKTSDKMTDQKIDRWYDLALKNGAFGGKIMGAGGGGFLLFYCDNNNNFVKNMEDAGLKHVPFHFDFDGSKVLLNI